MLLEERRFSSGRIEICNDKGDDENGIAKAEGLRSVTYE